MNAVYLICTLMPVLFQPLILPSQDVGLQLVVEGEPKATIVVSATAPPKVRHAANELSDYIAKMTGVVLPIMNDRGRVPGTIICVGRSAFTTRYNSVIPSGITSLRQEEGFSVICDGQVLVLAGNDEGPYHGTEYAVYDFLEKCGVRWYMPSDYGEVVPRYDSLISPRYNYTSKPSFVVRYFSDGVDDEGMILWKLRNKLNIEPMFSLPVDDSIKEFLPESLAKTIPDLFAQNMDGTRIPGMPNLSSAKSIETIGRNIANVLRANPNISSIALAPSAGFLRDFSQGARDKNLGIAETLGRAGIENEVGISDEWFTFINALAEDVKKVNPQAFIVTSGNHNRTFTPQSVRIKDNVIVSLDLSWSCDIHDLNSSCSLKRRESELVKRWSEACRHVIVNESNQYNGISLMLNPKTTSLVKDLKFYKQIGILGIIDKSSARCMSAGIASQYLKAKLLWNIEEDYQEALDEFYNLWYGDAADSIRSFYLALEDAYAKAKTHGNDERMLADIFSTQLLQTLSGHISSAEIAMGEDGVNSRLQAERMIFEHLKAYVEMKKAERNGMWDEALLKLERIGSLRASLYRINPYYADIMNEAESKTRADYYRRMSALVRTSLIDALPEKAKLKLDPYNDGVIEKWYDPQLEEQWRDISMLEPVYMQGYQTETGHPMTGTMWYRFKVNVPTQEQETKINLFIPQVECTAWVWVNGKFAGKRQFRRAGTYPNDLDIDITDAVAQGKTNLIAIRVDTGSVWANMPGGIVGRGFLYRSK